MTDVEMVRALVLAGYEWRSVLRAVKARDFTLLKRGA